MLLSSYIINLPSAIQSHGFQHMSLFSLLFNMESDSPSRSTGPSTVYIHTPDVQAWACRGMLNSPTSDKRWYDNVFISGGNPHLVIRFCAVV